MNAIWLGKCSGHLCSMGRIFLFLPGMIVAEQVLQRLREASSKLKPQKYSMLGHVVSQEGICTHPKKLQAVKNFHFRVM